MVDFTSRDIFISYKDDAEGNDISSRLRESLTEADFSVYSNQFERHSGSFPERLHKAVESCTDFILVLTGNALSQLIAHNKVDWIREELITAHNLDKNIIPVLFPGVKMPADKDDMPEDLRFLPDLDAIELPLLFADRPLDKLIEQLKSARGKGGAFARTYNSNSLYDVVSDFEATLKQAQAGDENAMRGIAYMYFYGIADENGGSSVDYRKAYYWFSKLAASDGPYKKNALRMISSMYYRGVVPYESQSYEKAYQCLKEADLPASEIHHLAFMKSIGSGCEFDLDEAIKMYQDAAETGETLSTINLADLLYVYGRFQEAAGLYERIYGKNTSAALKLGEMYKRGLLATPVKPDYFRAAFYFQHAIQAKNLDPKPYLELGILYFNPTGGFPKDFEKAQDNFIKAAELGSSQAHYFLGYMYQVGLIEQSFEKAAEHFTVAAESGHILSALHLATVFQQPPVQNYQKAFYYARIAAQSKLGEGEFIYANLLFLGRGCDANVDEAVKYYRRAVDHGYDVAKSMLERAEKIAKSS